MEKLIVGGEELVLTLRIITGGVAIHLMNQLWDFWRGSDVKDEYFHLSRMIDFPGKTSL